VPRAPKTCSNPHCPNQQPCPNPDHTPRPWAGSKRSTRTLSGSAQQRRAARVMREHERTCHVCGKPMADEVDHVVPLAEGGADDETNLRPIHSIPCHQAKTLAEARRARA
jgi:5-methylcytosine-specific restriction endonuclease McrA